MCLFFQVQRGHPLHLVLADAVCRPLWSFLKNPQVSDCKKNKLPLSRLCRAFYETFAKPVKLESFRQGRRVSQGHCSWWGVCVYSEMPDLHLLIGLCLSLKGISLGHQWSYIQPIHKMSFLYEREFLSSLPLTLLLSATPNECIAEWICTCFESIQEKAPLCCPSFAIAVVVCARIYQAHFRWQRLPYRKWAFLLKTGWGRSLTSGHDKLFAFGLPFRVWQFVSAIIFSGVAIMVSEEALPELGRSLWGPERGSLNGCV